MDVEDNPLLSDCETDDTYPYEQTDALIFDDDLQEDAENIEAERESSEVELSG